MIAENLDGYVSRKHKGSGSISADLGGSSSYSNGIFGIQHLKKVRGLKAKL